jgi:hypothetical protein
MSNYNEIYKSKMDWQNVFVRTGNFPLDRSSIFGSYEDAKKYAKGDGSDSRELGRTSYIGQIITVYENDEVDVYKITVSRELEPVGEGKGVMMAVNETEINQIASKSKSIGNFVFNVTNKTMYMVIAVNTLVELFKLNDKNETVYDCGTY